MLMKLWDVVDCCDAPIRMPMLEVEEHNAFNFYELW